MTYTSRKHQQPRCLTVGKPLDTVSLPVHGQGVLLFTACEPCSLVFYDVSGTPSLKVQFTDTAVHVVNERTFAPLLDPKNTKGLVKQKGASYWFSLDSQNQRFVAGIGEARKETSIYTFQFPQDATRKATKLWLERLTTVKTENLQIQSVLRDPITRTVPLLVKPMEELTLELLGSEDVLPKANLSIVAQKLYECIAGKQFVLNTPDFPEFTQAIEASIRTPGKWCYERLKQKSTEFDKNKPDEKETYLRITLGENNGESPGIPYVMEIWPVGHYSPIHNHGGASAVIRVLHGSIHVSLFPFLSGDALTPFAETDFKQHDITWISPTLNQVHQLKNHETNKDTCITIQCYMYKKDNTSHYDYFDYLDASGVQQQYEPDSDLDFLEFKKLMRKEWLEQTDAEPKSKWCFW